MLNAAETILHKTSSRFCKPHKLPTTEMQTAHVTGNFCLVDNHAMH